MSTTTHGKQQFKDKLRLAIDRKQIGITDLARRISGEAGGKELDATRRSIHKHLTGKAKPRREMRRRYETALGLELGDLEPDDEEADPAVAFMAVLMSAVDGFVDARMKSNGPAAHLRGERGQAATTTEVTHDGDTYD